MANRKHPLRATIDLDPVRARTVILAAFAKAGGSQRGAATEIDVHETTLLRWVKELDLHAELVELRARLEAAGKLASNPGQFRTRA